MSRWTARTLWLSWLGLVVGCAGLIPAQAQAAPFPECEADAYVYVGRSSLAAIGLGEQWPEQSQRIGDVWVTAGPPDPEHWPIPPGDQPPTGSVMCIEFDDGSGMSTTLDGAWRPPGGGGFNLGEASSTPLAWLAIVVAALVIVGVSLLAFRGRRPTELE